MVDSIAHASSASFLDIFGGWATRSVPTYAPDSSRKEDAGSDKSEASYVSHDAKVQSWRFVSDDVLFLLLHSSSCNP